MCIRPSIFNPVGYLWEFAISLNAPHPTPPPLLVLRQGRHASWMPNSPLSGHRATAAVAAIIRVNYSLSWCCVHITRPRIHVRVCCLLCESSSLWQSLQFAASHLIKAEVSVGGWGSKYYHRCLTCETLKCVANLGLSSCCPHPVRVFPGWRIIDVSKRLQSSHRGVENQLSTRLRVSACCLSIDFNVVADFIEGENSNIETSSKSANVHTALALHRWAQSPRTNREHMFALRHDPI